jgi:hypothetical protein
MVGMIGRSGSRRAVICCFHSLPTSRHVGSWQPELRLDFKPCTLSPRSSGAAPDRQKQLWGQLLPAETRWPAAQAKGLGSPPVAVVRALVSATSRRTAIFAIGQAGAIFRSDHISHGRRLGANASPTNPSSRRVLLAEAPLAAEPRRPRSWPRQPGQRGTAVRGRMRDSGHHLSVEFRRLLLETARAHLCPGTRRLV